ncbi:hypothetical protein EDB85DRAFT_2161608 [Lactarius pseudohatsudake]|nr:hypothetical protein EDB85DRAFT_2161608 [Lactarius pseudohatsudake]
MSWKFKGCEHIDLGEPEGARHEDVDFDTAPVGPPAREAAVENLVSRPELFGGLEIASVIRGDNVSEDEFNASPRPAFPSEAQPSSPQSRTNLFPVSAENSDVDMCNGSDFDQASFKPPSDAKGSVTAEEPQVVESDDTFSPPPVKKSKPIVHVKKDSKKQAKNAKAKVVETEEETEVLPKVPSKLKPKPKKLREEIRIATEGLKAAQVTKASGTTTAAGDKKGSRKDRTRMVADARDLFNDEVILAENSEQVSTRMRSDQNFITKKRKHDQTHSDAKPASEPRAPSWASHAAAQMAMSRKSGPGRSGSGSGPPPRMHTSAPSALTNNVKVISCVALPLAEVQADTVGILRC